MGWHGVYKPRKFEVGERLLALRTRTKLTQAELAERVGTTRRTILSWEAGASYPQEDKLQRLLSVFLSEGVLTAGQEHEEALSLWQQVNQDAPRKLARFDEIWFADLLANHGVRDDQATAVEMEDSASSANVSGSILLAPYKPVSSLFDWGEAPDVPVLYGREAELAILQRWIIDDRCRVVALVGLGGIGKTSLAVTFAHLVAAHFDAVLFRSLRNAPLLGPLLDDLIRAVTAQKATPPEAVTDKIALLIQLFRDQRCLLVFDNLETIIQEQTCTGDHSVDYGDYALFIQRLGEAAHRSCLLLTSREKPTQLGPLEGSTAPVRTLVLAGLAEEACQLILEEKDVFGATGHYEKLTNLYGGNPLALKLISEPIREVFGGNMDAFLASGDAFFNGVGRLLDQQFGRSTALEQALLYWLAIERELVSLDGLVADFAGAVSQRDILVALESLRRRLLIERSAHQSAFTLQPVIMEYLTDRLIERLCREIINGQPELLCTHVVVQATTKDYVRRSQERLIAVPLLQHSAALCGGATELQGRLVQLLQLWRHRPQAEQRYGPGNVVNLLRLLRGNLWGFDFSHLAIRQAYLQELEAQDVHLNGAHLTQSVLSDAFEYGTCVALSADGAYLAASTQGGEVRLWRTADRTPILSVPAHSGGAYGVTIAADGQLVVSSAIDGTAKVWAVPSGQLVSALRGHTGGVYCVALTTNQQVVAGGGADGIVRLWDVSSGVCLNTLQGHTGAVWDVAFAHDQPMLVSSSIDGTIKLWHVPSGQCLATLQGHVGPVWSVALRADGRILASGGADGSVRLWAVDSGVCLTVLQGHTGGVRGVALSADGRLLVSGGMDRTVRLWDTSIALNADADSGVCLAVLQGHTGGIWDVALSADGRRLASASFDGTIRLWDTGSRTGLAVLQGYSGTIRTVALAANGRIIACGSSGGIIRLWDPDSETASLTLDGHVGMVFSVALSTDLRILASSGHDGMVRLWDTGSGQLLVTLQGHTDAATGVALSADGQLLASGGRDGTIRLWHPGSGVWTAIWQAEQAGLRDITLLADGRLLVSGSFDGVIRLWDVNNGRTLLTRQAHTGMIWRVAISADGRCMASAGEDGTIRLWDTDNGDCLVVLEGHTGAVYGVALSVNGSLAVSGGHDGTIRWWHTESGTCQRVIERQGVIWNVALSEDGLRVVSGEHDSTIAVWDANTGALLNTLRPDRPYERMDISGLTGVTKAQRAALIALGAMERSI